MTAQHWRGELEYRLRHLAITVPSRSALHPVAGDICQMARSYLDDGDHFFSTGDTVNASASWSYALGWLDAGVCLGLIETSLRDPGWLFTDIGPCPGESERLAEKTGRYCTLLSLALTSLFPAPEPSTRMHHAAERFLQVAGTLLVFGRCFSSGGRDQNALGAFSYGHAWLDAGVRSGLFRVSAQREIFTV